jgi:hypothetical protein
MKYLLAILLFSLGFSSLAQDTTFIISDYQKVKLIQQTPEAGIVAHLELSIMPLSVSKTISGQYYTNYTDATGLHRRYLGWLPAQRNHAVTIFSNRQETRFWYWQFNKAALPVKVLLDEVMVPYIN